MKTTFLRKIIAVLAAMCLFFTSTDLTVFAAPGGNNDSAEEGHYYHIDILVEAEYEYDLIFEKNNIKADHADIEISKTWNVPAGTELPESIDVIVETSVANNTEVTKETVTLTAAEGWTKTLSNMPLYDKDSGEKITYSVTEDNVSAEGYYDTVVSEVKTSVSSNEGNTLVYTEGDKSITLFFDQSAPNMIIYDGEKAYEYGALANWVEGDDGTYSLVFTYERNELTYTSTWVYNPSTQIYTYISDDFMEVDNINYVTYTNESGTVKSLYNREAGTGYSYSEEEDTTRADQEFFSSQRNITDMVAGTEIVVGYDYTYGYYDKFGEWYSYSSSTSQTFDTDSEEFENVCGSAEENSTRRGYDVTLQLSDAVYYLGDGLKETYDVDITNTPVTDLTISKAVVDESGLAPADTVFTFEITLDQFFGETINGTFSNVTFVDGVATVSMKAGESVTISGLPVGLGYSIKETNIPDNYEAEAEVITGTLEANGSEAAFVNTYVPPTGNLLIAKEINHPYGTEYEIPADKQTFTIQVAIEGEESYTVEIKAGGEKLIENIPNGAKVTVTELNVPNGFVASYYPANEVTIEAGKTTLVDVINTYTADPVTIDVNIGGTKTMENWADETFTILLQEYADGSWKTIDTATVSAGNNGYSVSIDNKTFSAVGTYPFQVIEEHHGQTIGGITFDATMHTFDVVVTDKDMDGALEAEVVSTHDSGVSGNFSSSDGLTWTNNSVNFTNINNQGETALTIMIQKLLKNDSGSNLVNLEGYQFNLYQVENDGTKTLVTTSDHTDGAGESFVTLHYTYDDDGTYSYELEEVKGNVSGMSYSLKVYTFSVNVAAHENGTVVATLGESDLGTLTEGSDSYPLATFENVYSPDPAKVDLVGYKTLEGRDLKNGEFTFTMTRLLRGENNSVVRGDVLTETNNSDGEFTFSLIYDKVGSYYYEIAEKNEGLGGVTYDDTLHYVHVTVKDNGGKLEATALVLDNIENKISFNNTYEAKPVTVTLKAYKAFEDLTDVKVKVLEAGAYTFNLVEVDADGNQVGGGTVLSATNDADGNVVFGDITYNKAGTYYYQVSEVKGNLGGIAYDETVYTYKVVVTDNGVGALEADTTSASATFKNTYDVRPTSLPISGLKVLEGRALNAEEFEFVLIDNNGSEEVEISRVKNLADGSFTFDPVEIANEGTYYYIIREVAGTLGGVSYDTTEYTVIVSAEDRGNGELYLSTSLWVGNEQASQVVFTNTYKATFEGEHSLEGRKDLVGRDMTATDKFEFQVVDVYNTTETIVTNDINGVVVLLDGVTFDEAGEYEYYFMEVIPEEAEDTIYNDIAYDTVVYKYTVVVVDDLKGNLLVDSTTLEYVDTETEEVIGEADEVLFTNEYLTPELEIVKLQKVGTSDYTEKLQEAKANDIVLYEIQVTNTGRVAARNVVITDAIPEGLTLIDGAISDEGVEKDGVITWEIESLAAGDTVSVGFAVRVPSITENTSWKNIATVTFAEEQGREPQNSNEVEIISNIIPKTGDMAMPVLWTACALGAMMIVVVVLLSKRKTNW